MSSVVYVDDAQIVLEQLEKAYADSWGAMIEVWPLIKETSESPVVHVEQLPFAFRPSG